MLPAILTVNPFMKKQHRKAHTNRLHRIHHYQARGKKTNPFKQRRGHHYSNPFSSRGLMKSAVPVLIGATGAIGLDVLMAYLPLPPSLQSGWMNILTRAAAAVGIGIVAGKIAGREVGKEMMAGGLVVVAYSGLKQALAPTLGTSIKGLSGLADFGDYRPAWPGEYAVGASPNAIESMPRLSRMGAYMRPTMGAYIGNTVRYPGIGAYMNPGSYLAAPAAAPSSIAARQRMAGFGGFNGNMIDDM